MDAPVTDAACRDRCEAIRAEIADMRADMTEILRLLRGGIDSQETGIVGRVQKIEDERRTAGWLLGIVIAISGALGGAVGRLLK